MLLNRIEAGIVLAVSLTAGIVTFVKVAFPKDKNENDKEVEVEIDIDDSEVEPE